MYDLRNYGEDVIDRVVRGERLTVTRDGTPVAELRSLDRSPLPIAELIRRWSALPAIHLNTLRHDLDGVLDSGL